MRALSTVVRAAARFALTSALLLVCAQTIAEEKISSVQIRSLLAGNTVVGTNEKGDEYHIYHTPEGRLSGKSNGSYDEGTWEAIADAQYCRKYQSWRNASRDCYNFFRIADGQYRAKAIDKNYDNVLRVVPGDPEGLKAYLR